MHAYFNIFNAKPKRVVPVNIVYVASFASSVNICHLILGIFRLSLAGAESDSRGVEATGGAAGSPTHVARVEMCT